MKLADWQLAGIIAGAAVLVVVFFAMTSGVSQTDIPPPTPLPVDDGAAIEEPAIDETEEEVLEEPTTQEACEALGGTWDPCASACPPDVACIQVCVERCEL